MTNIFMNQEIQGHVKDIPKSKHRYPNDIGIEYMLKMEICTPRTNGRYHKDTLKRSKGQVTDMPPTNEKISRGQITYNHYRF